MQGTTHHTLLTFDPIILAYGEIVGIPFTDHCALFIQRRRVDGVCFYYMYYFDTHSGAMLVAMWACAHAYHDICCIVWLPFRWPCARPTQFSFRVRRHWDPGHTCKSPLFCVRLIKVLSISRLLLVLGLTVKYFCTYVNVNKHSNMFLPIRIFNRFYYICEELAYFGIWINFSQQNMADIKLELVSPTSSNRFFSGTVYCHISAFRLQPELLLPR